MEKIDTDFENWGSYLMKQFHTMYEKNERCDLEINCNKQIFLVHRLIMSACSDYVRELGETEHIILPDEISCKTLKTIIDFVYSGKIIFCKEDKDDLLTAAGLLNMRLLLELIKREDSSSYTISMDDDNDENCETELINNGTTENCRVSSDTKADCGPNSRTATKRKSDKKSVKNKSPKKNCVVLPPLHKFPYLQQKFSSSRTYGLITSFTSPTPSRFEISDAELEMNSIRSTFHDVTYDTDRLSDADNLKPLEKAHIEFLKKTKTTAANRRNFTNALYSPFDKYTLPCNVKLAETITTRRPESVVSYPSKVDAASNVRKYQVNNAVHAKETNTSRPPPSSQTASTATPPPSSSSSLPTRKEYKKQDTATKATPSPPVEKRVRFSDDVSIREIDIPFAETIANDLETLPEPIMPSAIVQDANFSCDGGHEVELIKLNNVVVPPDPGAQDRTLNPVDLLNDVDASVSLSIVQTDAGETTATSGDVLSDYPKEEKMEVEEDPNLRQMPASQSDTNVLATLAPTNDETTLVEPAVPTQELDSVAEVENVCIQSGDPEEQNGVENSISSAKDPLSSNGDEKNEVEPASKLSSFVDSIATDTTLFTPLSASSPQTAIVEPNSQIYALKVKGTESPAQINKLVDLCKNNPLFKNKNLRFKIVPVKGAIRDKLTESALKSGGGGGGGGGGINKAIIVKRTTPTSPSPSAEKSPIKLAEVPQRAKPASEDVGATTTTITTTATNAKKDRFAFVENISGPWSCAKCGGVEPLTFASYYDYRTHHHSVHKEPNNPVYCVHCGHKSLKRNMQLYHLFVKHNVKPPSHIKFPKCDKCEFHALNEYYLQKHLICHPSEGKEYVCSCKVAFKSSDLLQKHMVSGDCKNTKSFTCGYCRGIFDRFVNLKAHMRVCMKERSKPMLESGGAASNSNAERAVKTISEGGRDYLAL